MNNKEARAFEEQINKAVRGKAIPPRLEVMDEYLKGNFPDLSVSFYDRVYLGGRKVWMLSILFGENIRRGIPVVYFDTRKPDYDNSYVLSRMIHKLYIDVGDRVEVNTRIDRGTILENATVTERRRGLRGYYISYETDNGDTGTIDIFSVNRIYS